MKGNVTCSCGHSWNTSDSSKKDASVCHICGKDNTMKNGGWLDQYQEGGELDKDALSGIKNVLSAVSDVTSAPARGLTYLATGKYQDPSQAMGITNPIGAFLTDAILDPANLVGAGLATKVLKGAGKVNKVARAVDVADRIANTNTFQRMKIAPKNIPINPKQFKQASQSTIDALTQRGQELDRITNGKFNITPDDIHYHGTYAGRPVVQVHTPNGPEYFYKSTSWGGKKEIDPGAWQTFGQYMDAPAGTLQPHDVNNWFVKGKGFDNFYGSKSFGNVANSLDDVLIQKYGVPKQDLNKLLNFQNIQSDVNTFIPKRKDGGWLEKYNDGGPVQPNYNDYSVSAGPGFQGDGYSNVGRDYSPAWGGQFEDGGPVKRFMQPTETFKNYGYNSESNGMSTEYSTSIGGSGEVYLVPGYRQGRILQDPEGVFNAYGEHLGGPFKTVQAAEDFAQLRHKYVEQNKNIPAPFKTRDYAMGGSMPGAVGFMYARTNDPAPSNGKYAKKTKASAQNGTEVKKNKKEKTYYSGTLPEITVVGSKDPQTEEYYRNIMDRLTKEQGLEEGVLQSDPIYNDVANVDEAFSNPILTNKILGRYEGLMDLGKKYGFPKVHPIDKNSLLSKVVMSIGGDNKSPANYDPFSKTIQADNTKQWVSEMAHHVQMKDNKLNKVIQWMGNDLPALIASETMLGNRKGPYYTPGAVEHEAHSIIEPKLVKGIKKLESDYKKLPYINKLKDEFYEGVESLQNGGEMRYYQEGLDFKPKSISRDGRQLVKLDQLTNFTNYNTKQPGGWLDKYQ